MNIYFNQREYAAQLKRGCTILKIAAAITAAALFFSAR